MDVSSSKLGWERQKVAIAKNSYVMLLYFLYMYQEFFFNNSKNQVFI